MLVTPQLSEEIERILPTAQDALTNAMENARIDTHTLPNDQELTEVMLSVGDINLLVRKTQGVLRRYYG